jgi:Co/Zn/Cd efflux system component
MFIEVYVPTFSVAALVGVSMYITIEAINVVMNPPEDDNVDVIFLYAFAGANMAIDIICALCFSMLGSNVIYQKKCHAFSTNELALRHIEFLKEDASIPVDQQKNLNMISALTHVSGDTLRTLSVFIAALFATFSDHSGAQCDAWAAIVVTATIFGVVLPLIKEIYFALMKHFDH